MTKELTPELGQLAFGHGGHSFEVPAIWEAALDMLNAEIERVWGNDRQMSVSGPMNNSGERFDCDVFSAHAYDWGDDDQPWNFKWRDVRISWYKWCGRGMSSNIPLSADLASEMLIECLAAVRATEVHHG